MLIRLLLMLISGEGDGNKQFKASAAARRKRALDRVNKGKQNRVAKK